MKRIPITIFLFIFLLAGGYFYHASAQEKAPQTILPPQTKETTQPRGYGTKPVSIFTLHSSEQAFTVEPETMAEWQGSTLWPSRSLLEWQPQDLKTTLKNFIGTNEPQYIPAKLYHSRLGAIYDFVSQTSQTVDAPALEPLLVIENNRATSFTPPTPGIAINRLETTLAIANALENSKTSAEATVSTTTPRNFLSETNTLGITELVAQGASSFKGSPNNRRHNIKIGVEKMKGIIIAPGETFSFNKFLGEVDGEHGFLPELVIKKTGTVPEFGGGLCQVSSTAFRAAMNAGLPIVERRNHAYAVQYYAPQGTDATIYPGIVDLRFTNDTPKHILVWPYLKDKDTLIFDFYGTKDSRQITLDKPTQYDKKTDGSMKATWSRTVIKNGEELKDSFKSVYQSPALFHKTESTTTPPASTTVTAPAPASLN